MLPEGMVTRCTVKPICGLMLDSPNVFYVCSGDAACVNFEAGTEVLSSIQLIIRNQHCVLYNVSKTC
jgi:hypothetical protein